ncbi:MAG: hypothetical protein C0398_02010 [Coprothermobacter sp.]|nr:hypothetical protein [Coprothermobacter sp.]
MEEGEQRRGEETGLTVRQRQAVFIAPLATQHHQGDLSLMAILSRQSQDREKAHSAVALWASCLLTMVV